jgi:hypothetical protein
MANQAIVLRQPASWISMKLIDGLKLVGSLRLACDWPEIGLRLA